MDAAEALALRSLLESQPVASLATLHKGEPAVSMVPYALLARGAGLVIHVSRLATHTSDMLTNPAVALMVMAAPGEAQTPLALPRASIQGWARQCLPGTSDYAQARSVYLARLPQSEELFSFADFSLFVIEVRSARFVAGFARAMSVTASQFAAAMSAGELELPSRSCFP
jgi:putative heme iron utilization protein